MSADIINLRQARKNKARRDKEATAAENRERHGRKKAERQLTEARDDKDRRDLDAHRRERDETPSDSGPARLPAKPDPGTPENQR